VGLSNEELDGIAQRLYERFKKDLFINAGKGIVGFAWKGILTLLVILAAYHLGTK